MEVLVNYENGFRFSATCKGVSRQQKWDSIRVLVRGEVQAVSWGEGNCLNLAISAP